jgi:hypothetical protein
LPYQPYDTGWIKTIYSTICLGWFLLSTGLLPRFKLYSLHNNIYNPFATMVSTLCDFIGGTIISIGIWIMRFKSIIFYKFDYIQPIYNVIKYVESVIPCINNTTPSSLHYGFSNNPHWKTSSGKHLASYYVRKRLLRQQQVISGSTYRKNDNKPIYPHDTPTISINPNSHIRIPLFTTSTSFILSTMHHAMTTAGMILFSHTGPEAWFGMAHMC